jgi:hypothetical protein
MMIRAPASARSTGDSVEGRPEGCSTPKWKTRSGVIAGPTAELRRGTDKEPVGVPP